MITKAFKKIWGMSKSDYIKYGKKEGRLAINSESELDNSYLNLYSKLYSLIRKNPHLLKKFFYLAKIRGVKYAILKAKNKVLSLEKYNGTCYFKDSTLVDLDKILLNLDKKNIDNILLFYKKNKIKKPIDIIIPIYNGYEFLDKLFESLIKNTSLSYRLIIGNDKSPDKRVKEFISQFIEKNPNINTIFIDNKENMGFLKTVNLLASYAENHIVILNTDTELPALWLERLMYPIFSRNDIASTTPFTNSGTICSFPIYLDNNEIYKGLSLEDIDNTFKLINSNETMITVPTGVGFCMGMNFNLIKKIGMFDEIYGKGYGEENDWCQRAIQAGYKNIHLTNLFVYHKHGGSFLSEDKIRYINEHYQLLLNKFPTYDEQIKETISRNELKNIRDFMQVLLEFKFVSKKNILMFDHDLGGGANLYRNQKIKESLDHDKYTILFTYNINLNTYRINFYTKEKIFSYSIKNENTLLDVLSLINIDTIFINGLVSYPNIIDILDFIINLKNITSANLIFPVHDYFCISPNYTLLGENNKYTGLPLNLDEHQKFLESSTAEFKLFCQYSNIKIWREKWMCLLSSCKQILCFSQSSIDIMKTIYPELADKLHYLPHNIKGTFNNVYSSRINNPENIRVIGVLGNINLAKGSNVVKEIVDYIDTNELNARVVLIGNIDIEIKSKSFIKSGSYKKDEVPDLLKKYYIDEFIIPSVWPETYSYTTDEIMQLGYPISVFDLGAPAERVKFYERGKILSLNNYLNEIFKG